MYVTEKIQRHPQYPLHGPMIIYSCGRHVSDIRDVILNFLGPIHYR